MFFVDVLHMVGCSPQARGWIGHLAEIVAALLFPKRGDSDMTIATPSVRVVSAQARDGPGNTEMSTKDKTFTWGWTGGVEHVDVEVNVFPTRAGMNRLCASS